MLTLNLTKEEVEAIKEAFEGRILTVADAVEDSDWTNILALYSKAVHALEMQAEKEEIERFVELQQAPGQYRSDYYQESDEELWNS